MYFNCHSHTDKGSNIRILDCINKPKDLINKAIELGLAGIAITDHEALTAHVQVNKIMNELHETNPDFTIALGNEIYLIDKRENGQKYYHFILIAKDEIGHKALRELSSTAWLNSYFDRGMERVPLLKEELSEIYSNYKGHLIATTACMGGELGSSILKLEEAEKRGDTEAAQQYNQQIVDFMLFCIEVFGDDFYLECAPSNNAEQIAVNKRILSISKAFAVPITIGTDAHYLTKEDRFVHKAYLNSKNGEREVDSFYEFARLIDTEETIELLKLSYTDDVIQNIFNTSLNIKNKISYYSLEKKQHVTEIEVPDYPKQNIDIDYPILKSLFESEEPQERYWVNECWNSLRAKKLLDNELYIERLEEEARVKRVIGEKLETCVFAYPNTLKHYIDLFWECGSTVGAGRGSACAALNHYLLGITQLDPIEWNLPFWRYLNDERAEMPDVDLDLAPSKIQTIFSEIRKERGDLGLVQVATFGTETTKSAILTACRGYRSEEFKDGIDVDIAQYMSSLVPSERGFLWPLKDVVYGNPAKDRKPVNPFILEVNKYPGLLDIMVQIEGLVNKRSSHASGIILLEEDTYARTALMKTPKGAIITQFDLHDAEWMGLVKYDFLLTSVQDIIIQTIELLQADGQMEQDLSLREIYNKYLHPNVLPKDNKQMWDALANNEVISCFQFDSSVGAQAAKKIKPQTPLEMADANGLMRLMTAEKGAETPLDKYVRFKNNIDLWYQEMTDFGLSYDEQKSLEPYFLRSYGVPPSQEQMMMILQDPDICNFSLKEANTARKIVGKKQMDKIPELQEKVIKSAKTYELGQYIWKHGIGPQMGYSFSIIHALAYSFIGMQTLYLATQFNPIYWNTSCLIVNSGASEMGEDEATDYSKIAKAIGDISNRGVKVSLVDINHSDFGFKPDVANNQILFGLKGLLNVGDDLIETIINNRPYTSMEDFYNKVNPNRQSMIALIKSGAFDQFESRYKTMVKYIWMTCDRKKRLTLQNLNGLIKMDLIPQEFELEKRVFEFTRYLKSVCKINPTWYTLDERAIDFLGEINQLHLIKENEYLEIKTWDKVYQSYMDVFRNWINENKESLLEELNMAIFMEDWNKYAKGSLSAWEMEVMCTYYHDHELKNANIYKYGIIDFELLPEEPIIETFIKRGKAEIPIYKLHKICGTCIAKNKTKSTVYLLTTSGVVPVKFRQEYFSLFDKRISEKQEDGTKKVIEHSWFNRGNMIMVQGIRRGDEFVPKKYASSGGHQLYKIDKVFEDGDLQLRHERAMGYDEED